MTRRAGIDRKTVVNTAAGLIDAEGVDALTLGRLAARLGIQTPSLYNHVDGLPDLHRELALMSARQLGDRLANAAIGRSGPEALRALANAYRTYIKEHPGLYLSGLRASGAQVTVDEELRLAEERAVLVGMAVIGSFGLAGADALHAIRGFRSVVHGFATLEIAGGFGLPLDCDESFHRLVEMLIIALEHKK
jgi:AcrR family transcriptional regulator